MTEQGVLPAISDGSIGVTGRWSKKEQVVSYQQVNESSMPMLNLNLTHLIDDAKCYKTVRQMRWKTGICCPKCNSPSVINRGKDETQPERQRYGSVIKLLLKV